jgi:hypothetical protein
VTRLDGIGRPIKRESLDLFRARRDAALSDLAGNHREYYDHGEGSVDEILKAAPNGHELALSLMRPVGPFKCRRQVSDRDGVESTAAI